MPDTLSTAPIDKAALEQVFIQARTAYAFSDSPVSDDLLREAWEVARWAPTSANTQPARMLFVTSDAAKARLVEHMGGNNKERTANAPAVAVIALDTRFHDRLAEVMPPLASMAEMFEKDFDARIRNGTYSAALQAGYFILALRALGLAAGPMAGFDREGVDSEFFAGTNWKSQLVINIGYSNEESFRPRNPRLDVDEVVKFV